MSAEGAALLSYNIQETEESKKTEASTFRNNTLCTAKQSLSITAVLRVEALGRPTFPDESPMRP